MLFNSAIFILLFFIVYLFYWQVSLRWKHNIIIIASFLFYGWFSVSFLLLFLLLIFINYHLSVRLLVKKSKAILTFLIFLDAGVLVFFKYFYLLAESLGSLIKSLTGYPYVADLKQNWLNDHSFEIILPIAISFYTFQIIAWVVDCYRGTITTKIPFKKFCVFILFFPQFVAGPIMRSTDFMDQIDNPTPSQEKMLNGLLLILMGAVKKILIADRIGFISADIWMHPEKYDGSLLILLLFGFSIRIYCDFSGYTDMARGLAKLLGYEIPENFNAPYLARSMSEFWERWHITLTTWLRDYIFIPLGGSRHGEYKTIRNLLITMGLAGLWHGAKWTMVLWGCYIGFFMSVERLMKIKKFNLLPHTRLFDLIRIAWTFSLFTFSGILFAAPDIGRTMEIFKGIFTFRRADTIPAPETLIALIVVGFLFNIPQFFPQIRQYLKRVIMVRYLLITALTFVVGFLINLYGDVSGSFIYFAF